MMDNNFTSLKNYGNVHHREDFVIIGGGPSTKNLPSSFLDGKITIGCNHRPTHLRFDYHVLHDPLALMYWKKNNVDMNHSDIIFSHLITRFDEHIKSKQDNLNNSQYLYAEDDNNFRDNWVGDIPILEYLHEFLYLYEKPESWKDSRIYEAGSNCPHVSNHNIEVIGNIWMNSGFWCIDIAKHLEAKKIYLSGFDGGSTHNYSHPQSDRLTTAKNRNYGNHYVHFVNKMNQFNKDCELVLVNNSDSIYNLPKISV
jgi:hypothetical protein